jgi:hypothetical protein
VHDVEEPMEVHGGHGSRRAAVLEQEARGEDVLNSSSSRCAPPISTAGGANVNNYTKTLARREPRLGLAPRQRVPKTLQSQACTAL